MIDRGGAVNLARDIHGRSAYEITHSVTAHGVITLADAVLAMDEYIRSHEAVGRDAALWRDLVLLDQMDLMVIFGGAGSDKELLAKLAEWIERKRRNAPLERK